MSFCFPVYFPDCFPVSVPLMMDQYRSRMSQADILGCRWRVNKPFLFPTTLVVAARKWMNEWTKGVLGHNSAMYGYTRLGVTWVNEMNFVMDYAPDAGSMAQLIDLQSSILPLCYGWPCRGCKKNLDFDAVYIMIFVFLLGLTVSLHIALYINESL